MRLYNYNNYKNKSQVPLLDRVPFICNSLKKNFFLKAFRPLMDVKQCRTVVPKTGETKDCSRLLHWESFQAAPQERRLIQSPAVALCWEERARSVEMPNSWSFPGRVPERRQLHRERSWSQVSSWVVINIYMPWNYPMKKPDEMIRGNNPQNSHRAGNI